MSQRKGKILGVPAGTALNRLRKIALFAQLEKYGDNVCSICQAPIVGADTLSVGHKVSWVDNPDGFFDPENIRYKHTFCASPEGKDFETGLEVA